MRLPLLGPLRDLFRALSDDAAGRAATALATGTLAVVAAALVVSAGLVALAGAIGFPAAAFVFASLFAVLALAMWHLGRARAARRSARVAVARHRAEADMALASALTRSARPLLPLAATFGAFLGAFALARRL